MYVPPTIPNTALASAVNSRIKSDARIIAAKATLWRLGGVGLLCVGIGVGIGAACYGYSYVNDNRTSADKMASAFATALEHANLGTVRLNPESTVKINPEATVRLATDDATVKLAPGSMVHLAGEIPRPSDHQLAGDNVSTHNTNIVTHYTIFKTASFGKGLVVTGWNFSSSTEDFPDQQYCYYSEKGTETASLTVELAQDGKAVPQQNNNYNIDFPAAVSQCLWFR